MTGHATQEQVVVQVRNWLSSQTDCVVDSAFIYGSVAADTATDTSDIDFFLLTGTACEPGLVRRLADGFAELQMSLGYNPDPQYPLEVFTVQTCQQIVSSPEFQTSVQDFADGCLDAGFTESDEAEVLRALLNRRLTIRSSSRLDTLTDASDRLARSIGGDDWAARLGVKHPRQGPGTGMGLPADGL